MKTRSIASSVFAAIFILCAWRSVSAAAAAKNAAPKTVVDYFYLLPDTYFEYLHSKAQRKAVLFHDRKIYPYDFPVASIADVKHDYARIFLDSLGTLEVAVFRYHGRDLIGVRRYYDGCSIWFLTYQQGHWKDVTKQVMPVHRNANYNYVLPRYGTTIEVRHDVLSANNEGRKIYDLVWRKGIFQVRR